MLHYSDLPSYIINTETDKLKIHYYSYNPYPAGNESDLSLCHQYMQFTVG